MITLFNFTYAVRIHVLIHALHFSFLEYFCSLVLGTCEQAEGPGYKAGSISSRNSSDTAGFTMLWVACGSPVGHPWVTRGSPVGHPWVTRGSPVGHPWVTCGSPVGH